MNKQITKVISLTVSASMVATALAIAAPAGARDTYTPTLTPEAAPAAAVAVESVATFRPAAAAKRVSMIPVARTPVTMTGKATKAVAKSAPAKAAATKASTASKSGGVAEARSILAGLIKKHPILKGTTVEFGDARGYQAVAYYRSGRIVVSKNHTSSLTRILNHEVWHIIDWRDNGKIDWGEKVPPR